MVECEREECDVIFHKKKHNQLYCSRECLRLATNKKIMDKYYDDKARREGKPRFCTMCESLLSRYNKKKVCHSCETTSRTEKNKSAQSFLANVVG